MPLVDLDHVQLACPRGSEEEARRFFGGLLGLEEIEKPAELRARGGCWFRVGTRQLHLGVEVSFHPPAKAQPAFTTTDIETLLDRLEAAEVDCFWDTALPEVRRFYANDPWGNRLEFLEAGC